MVFQQPNPFPKSIYDNVAYAPIKHGIVSKGKECDELVETSLRKSGLWNEVKDKLNQPGNFTFRRTATKIMYCKNNCN